MRRISTSVNPFSAPTIQVKEYGLSNGNGEQSDDNVLCLGSTAQLHTRTGNEETQGRRASVVMPVLYSPRRQSVSARSAGSAYSDDLPSPPDNSPRDASTGPKFILNVISESGDLLQNMPKRPGKRKNRMNSKLPSIKSKNPKSPSAGRKKPSGSTKTPSKGGVGGGVVENPSKVEKDKTAQNSTAGEDTDMSKYGLDLKRDFGWEISRAFTYSYFPKLKPAEKKKTPRKKVRAKPKMDISGSEG